MTKEAIENLRRATTLYGKAAEAYLWLGKALKRASTFDQAEAAFKRANELTNGKSAEVHWQTAGFTMIRNVIERLLMHSNCF